MKIVTTSINKPPKICIYGQPGAGKSRFAASCPRPFFIRTEDRHSHLGVETHENVCDSYGMLLEILDWLATEDHPYKTVVLDTADSAEKLIHAKVCADAGVDNILHPKAFPFYSGFVRAAAIWETEILTRLGALNEEKKIMPVIVSHVETKYVEHPEYGSYPKFSLGVDKRCGAKIFKFCDIVGFLEFATTSAGEGENVRLKGSNQRVLRLKPRPFWETKESYNLPAYINIPEDKGGELTGWSALAGAIKEGLKARVSGDLSEIKVERDLTKLGA